MGPFSWPTSHTGCCHLGKPLIILFSLFHILVSFKRRLKKKKGACLKKKKEKKETVFDKHNVTLVKIFVFFHAHFFKKLVRLFHPSYIDLHLVCFAYGCFAAG